MGWRVWNKYDCDKKKNCITRVLPAAPELSGLPPSWTLRNVAAGALTSRSLTPNTKQRSRRPLPYVFTLPRTVVQRSEKTIFFTALNKLLRLPLFSTKHHPYLFELSLRHNFALTAMHSIYLDIFLPGLCYINDNTFPDYLLTSCLLAFYPVIYLYVLLYQYFES